ncbi:carbohydrate kinase [Thalassotalea sp. 1_MG-2023]|uniref:carbohydrate kinase family protein n=1 Tax=Thalassotalea sp. 1_MG-2023 TaxID=3062680 RepID=UPI0026E4345D|nr:carbohydrate kinase [Thalassotalea sp. 1_MG-2023]MDO6426014.1 carbohydrate kinase [Thalassotalea sp. 1_MG-2023]
MKPVICFGEALIDFLNVDVQQQDKLSIKSYRQFPGGAPANAAVAVAKLGGKAHFVGQVGKDAFGDFLITSMCEYGVDVSFTYQHPTAPTALAFVMLDKDNDRSFSFYRDNSADVIFSANQIDSAWFTNKSIFHFCSNTLTTQLITESTQQAIKIAKQHSALLCFDVNLRHNLWAEGYANKERVQTFIMQADVLKFSAEELEYLADGFTAKYIQACIANGCKLLVITDGGSTVRYITPYGDYRCEPPVVEVADTTGGGDGFIGALLFMLSLIDNFDLTLQDELLLKNIINFACGCGGIAVSEQGAFPAFAQFEQALHTFNAQQSNVSQHFTNLIELL